MADSNEVSEVIAISPQVDQKNIFDVRELYSPQGDFIGYIPTKRYYWYIKKGLCTIMSEKAIKINFEPSCDHKIDREKENSKENICIVCQCDKISSLKRFRIVPFELKKYFPADYKEHKFSDLVVLCKSHAVEGEKFHHHFKTRLFKQYEIDPKCFHVESKLLYIYIKAKKLIEQNYIYANEHVERQFREYFGGELPSQEQIQGIIQQVKDFKYEGYESADEMLVDKILPSRRDSGECVDAEEDGKKALDDFVRLWKEQFVEYFQPQIIPFDYWSIEQ